MFRVEISAGRSPGVRLPARFWGALVASALVTAFGWPAAATAQCNWLGGTGKITETCGNIGIGTTAPAQKLSIGAGHLLFDATFGLLSVNGAALKTGSGGMTWQVFPGSSTSNLFAVNNFAANTVFLIVSSGNVGIGTTAPSAKLHVNGNAIFNGTVTGTNIQAQYQDLAEWVSARRRLSPATVVVIDSDAVNEVAPSSRAYDTRVAGVISAQPGLLLGQAGKGKAAVATTGRVKVRVDATNESIRVGDLLVTSDREGFAMRSEPVDVAGIKLHRPGTLLGKALEPLEKGKQGEILVLLSLQ